jgi:hypothetical protein
MAEQFIDLDKVPEQFNCSRDRLSQLIAKGAVQVFPAKRKIMRTRGGQAHETTVTIGRVSRARLREALKEHEAWAEQGEGLTNAEMKQALGICQTLWDHYKVECDPLGGNPIKPTGKGRRNGRKVDLFTPAIRDAILTVYRDAKEGRVVIKDIAYLSTTKALDTLREKLRDVQPQLAYRTLAAKLTPKKWQLLPGRGLPEFWWVESEVLAYADELIALKNGRYVTGNGTLFTANAGGKQVGLSGNTISTLRKEGLIESESVPNRRGPGRTRKVYTLTALREAKRISQTPRAKAYDNGTRINLRAMAALLAANVRWVTNFVAHLDDMAKLILRPEPREQRGQAPETTVLKAGVRRLKKDRLAALKEAKALKRAGWGTANDVARVCPRSGEVLAPIFEKLRESGSQCAREALWPVPLGPKNRKHAAVGLIEERLRRLWIFNIEKAKDLVAQSPASAPPPTKSCTTALSKTERKLVETAREQGPLKGVYLALAAGYPCNSYIRGVIGELVQKGHLQKTPRGYIA